MGNNLKIMGNTFSNVSSITAHDATSGTHKYVDTSDTTAVAGDVKKNKTFYGADGVKIQGTLEDSGGGASVNLYQFHFSGFNFDLGYAKSTEDLDDYDLLPTDFAPANGKYIFAWVDGLPNTGTTINYADENYDDEYDITGIIYKIVSFNDSLIYYDLGGGKYNDQFDITCSFLAHDSYNRTVVTGDFYFGLGRPGRSDNKMTAASGNLIDMVNNRDMYYAYATVNYTLNIMIVDTN